MMVSNQTMDVVISICISFNHVMAKVSSSSSLGRSDEINELSMEANKKVLAQVSFSISNLSNFVLKICDSRSDSFTSRLNLGWFSTTLTTTELSYGSCRYEIFPDV